MHRWMERTLIAALAVAALAVASPVVARGDVMVTLTADLIIPKGDGREAATSAATAKPGDVVEYRATYKNLDDAAVRKLDATLPIPVGMEYLARSASPAPALASVDGHEFAPLPLRRRVRLADGREVTQEVPTSEYRFLRWAIGTLAAHDSRTVRARARVSSGPVSALVQH